MNHLLIGVSAALAVGVVVLIALLVVLSRRSSQHADDRADEVVQGLEARMDELAHALTGAIERAEEETRRSQLLVEVSGSINLDEVLDRALEAAASLLGADATLIQLEAGDGEPIVAAHGLPVEEAARRTVAGPPDGAATRSIELAYRYGDESAAATAIRAGLAVPLLADDVQIGHLTVFTRDGERRFTNKELRTLEDLAERAAPAIENSRRFHAARQMADLDALTGLHNRRYFHETLAHEVARAHRYGRRLALVILDLDDFKAINDRVGHLSGDAVLAEAAARIREVVRAADTACRIGGDEFAVIVPESGVDEAELLIARIQRAVSSTPIAQAGRVRISAGVAELLPQDDSVSLFERADERLYAAKETGQRGFASADGPA
jgi:diguanylate cyclase (GGDEF)-like protein